MTEPTIRCPNCQSVIKLTESLAAPLIESTAGMYCEVQSIAGMALQETDRLEVHLLEGARLLFQ